MAGVPQSHPQVQALIAQAARKSAQGDSTGAAHLRSRAIGIMTGRVPLTVSSPGASYREASVARPVFGGDENPRGAGLPIATPTVMSVLPVATPVKGEFAFGKKVTGGVLPPPDILGGWFAGAGVPRAAPPASGPLGSLLAGAAVVGAGVLGRGASRLVGGVIGKGPSVLGRAAAAAVGAGVTGAVLAGASELVFEGASSFQEGLMAHTAGKSTEFSGRQRAGGISGLPQRVVPGGTSPGSRTMAIELGHDITPGMVTKVWVANGTPFGMLADGRGVVQKRDGRIKIFRYPKHIVLSRNPRIRDLVKATTQIDRLTKKLIKAPAQAKRAKDRVKG